MEIIVSRVLYLTLFNPFTQHQQFFWDVYSRLEEILELESKKFFKPKKYALELRIELRYCNKWYIVNRLDLLEKLFLETYFELNMNYSLLS